ncbi:hypothetical protein RI367_004259 [Sorochytrium milnesiophthora]
MTSTTTSASTSASPAQQWSQQKATLQHDDNHLPSLAELLGGVSADQALLLARQTTDLALALDSHSPLSSATPSPRSSKLPLSLPSSPHSNILHAPPPPLPASTSVASPALSTGSIVRRARDRTLLPTTTTTTTTTTQSSSSVDTVASPATLQRADEVKQYLETRYSLLYSQIDPDNHRSANSFGYNPLHALRLRHQKRARQYRHRHTGSASSLTSPTTATPALDVASPVVGARPSFPFNRQKRLSDWEVDNAELADEYQLRLQKTAAEPALATPSPALSSEGETLVNAASTTSPHGNAGDRRESLLKKIFHRGRKHGKSGSADSAESLVGSLPAGLGLDAIIETHSEQQHEQQQHDDQEREPLSASTADFDSTFRDKTFISRSSSQASNLTHSSGAQSQSSVVIVVDESAPPVPVENLQHHQQQLLLNNAQSSALQVTGDEGPTQLKRKMSNSSASHLQNFVGALLSPNLAHPGNLFGGSSHQKSPSGDSSGSTGHLGAFVQRLTPGRSKDVPESDPDSDQSTAGARRPSRRGRVNETPGRSSRAASPAVAADLRPSTSSLEQDILGQVYRLSNEDIGAMRDPTAHSTSLVPPRIAHTAHHFAERTQSLTEEVEAFSQAAAQSVSMQLSQYAHLLEDPRAPLSEQEHLQSLAVRDALAEWSQQLLAVEQQIDDFGERNAAEQQSLVAVYSDVDTLQYKVAEGLRPLVDRIEKAVAGEPDGFSERELLYTLLSFFLRCLVFVLGILLFFVRLGKRLFSAFSSRQRRDGNALFEVPLDYDTLDMLSSEFYKTVASRLSASDSPRTSLFTIASSFPAAAAAAAALSPDDNRPAGASDTTPTSSSMSPQQNQHQNDN